MCNEIFVSIFSSVNPICGPLTKYFWIWFGFRRYVFLTFSAYFLSGSIISVLMNKCMKANKIVLIGEVKSCLKYYNCVRSKLGPLLLIFMSIDSLLVMLNTFMSYLACSPKYYVYMITYILWTLNGMLSLIYICVLCDACFNTLKGLLIPIRYT